MLIQIDMLFKEHILIKKAEFNLQMQQNSD